MGMSLDRMLYLQERGHLKVNSKLLDIGPQNVYTITEEQIRKFLAIQRTSLAGEELEREVRRLIYFSTPRPDERTTLLSELTDLTSIEYNSFDVCPGLRTDIVDLNFDSLKLRYRNYYDIVLNFGTTEHIFNQWNSFKIMHEAMKPGGVLYCQLPATGYLGHGYYCYTPLFFQDMAKANDYIVLDLFFTEAGSCSLEDLGVDVRDQNKYLLPNSAPRDTVKNVIIDYNIHAVMRKTTDSEFRCGLEIATSHAGVNAEIQQRYCSGGRSGIPGHEQSVQQLSSSSGSLTASRLLRAVVRNVGRLIR